MSNAPLLGFFALNLAIAGVRLDCELQTLTVPALAYHPPEEVEFAQKTYALAATNVFHRPGLQIAGVALALLGLVKAWRRRRNVDYISSALCLVCALQLALLVLPGVSAFTKKAGSANALHTMAMGHVAVFVTCAVGLLVNVLPSSLCGGGTGDDDSDSEDEAKKTR